LILPWNIDTLLSPDNLSWKQLFYNHWHYLSPQLSQYINNLDLLHKTREETQFDYLQCKAQEALQLPGNLSSILFDNNIEAAIQATDEFNVSDSSYSTAV